MARKPSVPCAGCGELRWGNLCHPCRRSAAGRGPDERAPDLAGARRAGLVPRTCPTCKTLFTPTKHPDQRFCTRVCRDRKLGSQPPSEKERARIRAKTRARGTHHSARAFAKLRAVVLERDAWTCRLPVCKQPTRAIPRTAPRAWHPASASVDLIIPKSRGGSDKDISNLRAAHFGCNSSRGNRTQPVPTQSTVDSVTSRDWLTG